VVTNNFMLTGGDGYSAFTRGRNQIDLGFILADVVEEYIAARSPVNVTTDGRISEGTAAAVPGGPAPVAPGVPTPAELPRTGGGGFLPAWVLGALAAGALGAGLRLRERAVRASAELVEQVLITEPAPEATAEGTEEEIAA
ncbi:MAG TPA: hypothetical protein PKC19_03500, partial [Roseiflexaceae bacterium]|nr:hypothetical protein [Roseiflexaceae bacterium]